jgi:hypothetical protein
MNIIAYGSLMNQPSLEKSLGRQASLYPITLLGYERIFNAPFGHYAFLNLQPAKNTTTEVAYFNLNTDEVEKFSIREQGSDLVEVESDYYAFLWPIAKGKLLPVLQSYIDVCQTGADHIGINLWRNTIQPTVIIDDSRDPLYPNRA